MRAKKKVGIQILLSTNIGDSIFAKLVRILSLSFTRENSKDLHHPIGSINADEKVNADVVFAGASPNPMPMEYESSCGPRMLLSFRC